MIIAYDGKWFNVLEVEHELSDAEEGLQNAHDNEKIHSEGYEIIFDNITQTHVLIDSLEPHKDSGSLLSEDTAQRESDDSQL